MLSLPKTIRIGTRSSPMALVQTERVRRDIALQFPDVQTEVVPITTHGDRWKGPLSALGGKGAFTKEVDSSLLDGECDIAVHCMKDVPGDRPVPEGLVFASYMERDNMQDAVVHPEGLRLAEMPEGSRVGTSAVRRIAQLSLHYPHLRTVPIRGNANSRIAKLENGEADALILAVSGLERIEQTSRISEVLSIEVMCPPIGAGVLGLQCRQGDEAIISSLRAIGDERTMNEVTAERVMLHVLQGHCNSPIAGFAQSSSDGGLSLRAKVFSADGKVELNAHERGNDATQVGVSVALELLRQGARELIDSMPPPARDGLAIPGL